MRQQQNIERLFRSYYEAMYNLARYLLADDDEGKDVVSDVFTQLLESSAVLIPGTERAYLMQSVRHHCFNRIAHMGVRQRVARLLADSADIVLNADTDNRLDRLTQLIDHLEPPLRQQIFRLRYLQGLSYQEVTHAVGVSKVTVYHHLAQAIEWIKSKLK